MSGDRFSRISQKMDKAIRKTPAIPRMERLIEIVNILRVKLLRDTVCFFPLSVSICLLLCKFTAKNDIEC